MSRSEDTRDHIIEKAAPIFNMYGYAGTSMSQLTRAIDMTKGAIYGNFKDKDEIALASFDYNFAKISNQIEQVVRPRKNACDKLIALANYYLEHFGELSNAGGCPILNAAVDSDDVHAQLKNRVADAMARWMETIVRIIYSGVKHGQIAPTVKAEQLATLFVSLIEGGILLSKTTGNIIHLSRNVDHLIHLVNSELRI